MNPYKVLGINNQEATIEEIRKQYRDLSKTHHPDKGGDKAVFAELAKAYEILSDKIRRKMFDEQGIINPTEKLDKQSEALLQQLFQNIISKVGLTGVLTIDVIGEMKNMIGNGLGIVDKKQNDAEENIRAANKVLGKFKFKNKKNPIQSMIHQDINKNGAVVTQCNSDREVAKRTRMLLKDYTFDFEKGMVHRVHMGSFAFSGTTTGSGY